MRRPPCMRFRAAWLLVVMALSALPARGGEQPAVDSPPGAPAAGWRALATPPVTPRTGSTTAWTGEEALFLGGTTKRLCPPAASCVEPARTARDGAAYNPSDGTWRRTAPAPVELPGYGHAPIVGDDVFQLIDDELQVYDASADAWRTEPGSPGPADGAWSLHGAGARLVALRQQQRDQYFADQVYDPSTGKWAPLPKDRLVPSFGRDVTWSPHATHADGEARGGPARFPTGDLAAPRCNLRRGRRDVAKAACVRSARRRRLRLDGAMAGRPHSRRRRRRRGQPLRTDRAYGGTIALPSGDWWLLTDPPQENSGGWPLYAAGQSRTAIAGADRDCRLALRRRTGLVDRG